MLLAFASLLSAIFTFVELNCENLFDCQHDTLKQDGEFLPDGIRLWNSRRYWDKLDAVGREIVACGEQADDWRLPDMVALCEVENDSVCRDLCRRSLLRKAGYEYVVTQSPDLRGIDVALLYSPYAFRLLSHRPLRVTPLPGMRPTRDILYAEGLLRNGDTLHVFVVHAPSRYGGKRRTRPHRRQVAGRLQQAVDSLRALHPNPHIIVAGDMNDAPDDPLPRHTEALGLTNLTRRAQGSHGARATYKYRGRWQGIDHIFVSPTLLPHVLDCTIADRPFLLEEDKRYGGVMPRRNFSGLRYNHGYSDHLPLVARFSFP